MTLPKTLTTALVLFVMALTVSEIIKIADRKPQRETISVQGQASVPVRPDMALLQIGLVAESPEPSKALADGTAQAAALVAALSSNGVASEDIVQTSFQLGPIFSYPDNRPPQVTGYRLSQGHAVKVRDLTLTSKILAEAAKAAARVEGPSFEPADPDIARARARKLAFAEARARALSLTQAAGVQLGKLVSFTESNSSQPPPPPGAQRAPEDPGAGDAQSIVITVDVVYEIN